MEPSATHGLPGPAAAHPGPVVELAAVDVVSATDDSEIVLFGVNWTVRFGDFWVVGGLHGSGKTLLLETAAGLHPCNNGEVRLFGHRILGNEGDSFAATRRRIGVVFEGGGRLFQQQTVAENVALPLLYHRETRMEDLQDELGHLMEACGIRRLSDVTASRLGRAWQQRVALARALALGPEILILDNPLAGLDAAHMRWWRQLLHRLIERDDGAFKPVRTVLVACDDFRPWLDLGRQFALAGDGRWEVLGSAMDVRASTHATVRTLLNQDDPTAP